MTNAELRAILADLFVALVKRAAHSDSFESIADEAQKALGVYMQAVDRLNLHDPVEGEVRELGDVPPPPQPRDTEEL